MEGIEDKVEEGKKTGVVREIKCGTYDKCNIGVTGRSAEMHVKEQFARNEHELSTVAKHAVEGNEVEFKAKIIEVADKTRVRRIKEALAIQRKDKNGKIMLNRDKNIELTNMWLDLV